MQRTDIALKKLKILTSSLAMIGLGVFGVYILFSPITIGYGKVQTTLDFVLLKGIGAVFTGIGIWGLVVAWRKCVHAAAGLVIDRNGFTDNLMCIPSGFVRWSDIAEIWSTNLMGHQFIAVSIREPEVFASRQSSSQKLVSHFYRSFADTEVIIDSAALKLDHATVMGLMKAGLEAFRALQSSGDKC